MVTASHPSGVTGPITFSGQRPSNYYRWSRHVHFRTPNLESKPDPETPEPEDPTDPEPEPETPDHSHPVQRCDHLAIVPALPGALAGDEDAPDHWLHVANPGAAGITFTVTGRDMAGAKGGTYRRELPAYRSVKVKMRDIEAAFDVAEPEGWWTLTVTGSGPLYVAATMRQGDARRFVPVERPATCGTGAVTRTGGGYPSRRRRGRVSPSLVAPGVTASIPLGPCRPSGTRCRVHPNGAIGRAEP